MKKFLLSTFFLFCITFYSNSQVIDVVGTGTNGLPSSNLQFVDIENIEHIDVRALKSWGGSTLASQVTFSNYIGNGSTLLSTDIINRSNFSPSPGLIFEARFDEVDPTGINLNIVSRYQYFQSIYAFVYRDISNPTFKSYSSLETVYFYWKDAISSEYTYNVSIDEADGPRDIKVKIPISELANDERPAIIEITAGDKTIHDEIFTYLPGNNSFILKEYSITNVNGDVSNVSINIHSPNEDKGEANGDSFYVNGIVVDVDLVFDGCTYTQGYWKTHSDCKINGPDRDNTWDNIGDGNSPETTTMFFKSEQTYCEVFDTKPNNRNGKYYILAHQYIAAELNLYNYADPTDLVNTFNEASAFLKIHTPEDIKGDTSLEAECVRLAKVLDDFNNGRIGPGHCDDKEEASIQKVKPEIGQEISIYPNPVSGAGTISFIAQQGGNCSVELYNMNGRKAAILYKGKTKKNDEVLIEYNTLRFKRGLYLAIIKDGTDVYRKKVSITK